MHMALVYLETANIASRDLSALRSWRLGDRMRMVSPTKMSLNIVFWISVGSVLRELDILR